MQGPITIFEGKLGLLEMAHRGYWVAGALFFFVIVYMLAWMLDEWSKSSK